ncbi:hypothetical protein J6590_047114 [Homalodisca vitripennis]|nr:hypothetical protein J6590_047114 [Homalodisca vitripennis]
MYEDLIEQSQRLNLESPLLLLTVPKYVDYSIPEGVIFTRSIQHSHNCIWLPTARSPAFSSSEFYLATNRTFPGFLLVRILFGYQLYVPQRALSQNSIGYKLFLSLRQKFDWLLTVRPPAFSSPEFYLATNRTFPCVLLVIILFGYQLYVPQRALSQNSIGYKLFLSLRQKFDWLLTVRPPAFSSPEFYLATNRTFPCVLLVIILFGYQLYVPQRALSQNSIGYKLFLSLRQKFDWLILFGYQLYVPQRALRQNFIGYQLFLSLRQKFDWLLTVRALAFSSPEFCLATNRTSPCVLLVRILFGYQLYVPQRALSQNSIGYKLFLSLRQKFDWLLTVRPPAFSSPEFYLATNRTFPCVLLVIILFGYQLYVPQRALSQNSIGYKLFLSLRQKFDWLLTVRPPAFSSPEFYLATNRTFPCVLLVIILFGYQLYVPQRALSQNSIGYKLFLSLRQKFDWLLTVRPPAFSSPEFYLATNCTFPSVLLDRILLAINCTFPSVLLDIILLAINYSFLFVRSLIGC